MSDKEIYLTHPYGLYYDKEMADTLEQEFLSKGLTVFNPVTHFSQYDRNHPEIVQYCLDILDKCQELYIAKGWEHSKACVMEHEFATKRGIPITYFYSGLSPKQILFEKVTK